MLWSMSFPMSMNALSKASWGKLTIGSLCASLFALSFSKNVGVSSSTLRFFWFHNLTRKIEAPIEDDEVGGASGNAKKSKWILGATSSYFPPSIYYIDWPGSPLVPASVLRVGKWRVMVIHPRVRSAPNWYCCFCLRTVIDRHLSLSILGRQNHWARVIHFLEHFTRRRHSRSWKS